MKNRVKQRQKIELKLGNDGGDQTACFNKVVYFGLIYF